MWACTHPEMFAFRQEVYSLFMSWLREVGTAPEIIQMFEWVFNIGSGSRAQPGNRAIQAATEIGRINVAQGLIPRACKRIQTEFNQ